ncbi:uncharacterized protein LOC130726163 [Lotus japonicus]|uniref:uncharacterized protein LOC130726163 n=1 Tax=Lotus japonicus TaxID=34305 RepID=UPI0025845E72|nr:uncharacterized protein LOC130726163 [Lotus japonicus]
MAGLGKIEEDDDARRIRLKEEWLLRREQEESEEEEFEEVEEEEEEFEEEESPVVKAPAPVAVFVPKSERHTIAERERLEAEQRALEEVRIRRLEERRLETKQMILVQEIHIITTTTDNTDEEEEEDDDDDVNEAEEYEAWKVREIGRIRRVREDREAILKEKQETQRLRNMSEEERIREWQIRNKNPKQKKKNNNKWRFMQRYYHSGAFFQDQLDTIMLHDFSAPTGQDKMDKTILPSVMQVKRFGLRGRSKWTHLINEDTTTTHHPTWTCNHQSIPKRRKLMSAYSYKPHLDAQ